MDLFDELMSLVARLDEAGVEYALAGGLAVAVWGVPRATEDIDLLVEQPAVAVALEVARRGGFTTPALPMRFADGPPVHRVSKAQGEEVLTLDLLVVTPELEPVFASRRRLDTERGDLWVVSRDALIRMKTAAGRPQDLADVRRLQDLDR